jgi:hypothetical protein
MHEELSVSQILANLESQLALHREQAALHQQQEELHREQRTRHAAEVARLSEHYETFKAAMDAVEPALRLAEAVEAQKPPPPSPPPDDRDLGPKPKASQAFDRVVASWPAGTPLGARAVAQEVNRRFPGKFRRFDSRLAGTYLRRRCTAGLLREVREGRPFAEALYTKPDAGSSATAKPPAA